MYFFFLSLSLYNMLLYTPNIQVNKEEHSWWRLEGDNNRNFKLSAYWGVFLGKLKMKKRENTNCSASYHTAQIQENCIPTVRLMAFTWNNTRHTLDDKSIVCCYRYCYMRNLCVMHYKLIDSVCLWAERSEEELSNSHILQILLFSCLVQ